MTNKLIVRIKMVKIDESERKKRRQKIIEAMFDDDCK